MSQSKFNFSDPQFIEDLTQKKEAAIEQVIRTYTQQLYRASLGMGFNENEAKELTQNTWSTFYDVISRFEGRSHIRTFIFGILYNKANEMRRDLAKQRQNDPIEEVMEHRFDESGHWISAPISPDEMIDAIETKNQIENCIEKLPKAQRLAFYLKEFEDLATQEICKILEVTHTNLGVLLYRARNRLRECLESFAKTEI
ncbi:MAG: hypothetical protein CL678_06390 [Bdellovibrionaceae bacterium]|nr:hypothetical protein [Pseudobdellovibrionaceae bacterium]|tara:strand:- start:2363 stop:2959 length:597 start_codon:yes stop_codon:yes gene_type:complete